MSEGVCMARWMVVVEFEFGQTKTVLVGDDQFVLVDQLIGDRLKNCLIIFFDRVFVLNIEKMRFGFRSFVNAGRVVRLTAFVRHDALRVMNSAFQHV